MVGEVEGLRSELQVDGLTDLEVFHQPGIQRDDTRAIEDAPAGIAERPASGNLEGVGVEPLVGIVIPSYEDWNSWDPIRAV